MKIGSIDIDKCIINALRDNKLVIFAGAGVSMGAPSNLPSFEKLTEDIAKGTGDNPWVPYDRFLGTLQQKGISVHQRAVQCLSKPESSPNTLHYNLVSLFRSSDRVRLVTTNFDYHFENAAKKVFADIPEIYHSPALPLGRDFHGIIHVHGSLKNPDDMVLTDSDFGRGYLTEGWARRFLVEVFQSFTVLFIGYSYKDIVMNYLTRALPSSNMKNHFALTEHPEDWLNSGITPISFNLIDGTNRYFELYNCIDQLTKRSNRGVFDWQKRITEICMGEPPIEDELIGELEQVLEEDYTTRFFTDVARDIHWPKWMSEHNYLDALFCDTTLNERDRLLASWLVEKYVTNYPNALFELFSQKGIHLNYYFWISIVRELGLNQGIDIEESIFSKWIVILLEGKPSTIDSMSLIHIAKKCTSNNTAYLALKIFFTCIERQLTIKPDLFKYDENIYNRNFEIECNFCSDQWVLNEIWTDCLKPHLPLLAQPLISGIVYCFESMFFNLMAWGKASKDWDMLCMHRRAVKLTPEDENLESADVLINALTDTLEWISNNSLVLLESWIERLIVSDVPILRRLSVYAINLHSGKSSDEILLWLANHISLNSLAEHHEIYETLELNYPKASPTIRKHLVDTILAFKLLETEEDRLEEEKTDREHFNLLSWLVKSKPDCLFAKSALLPIAKRYPKWRISDDADFLVGKVVVRWGSISPWTVDQLLAMNPQEKINELLSYKGDFFDGPDRDGLISNIEKACKQNVKWALSMINILIEIAQWNSDLWPSIIRGLRESDLSEQDYKNSLKVLARQELYIKHSLSIAQLLNHIVKDVAKPYALSTLNDSNKIASEIWEMSETTEINDSFDWLQNAINTPEGVIVEYWLNSLSLVIKNRQESKIFLPDNYKQRFTQIINDPTIKGGFGRSLLASNIAFLYSLDDTWVRKNIIPLFNHKDHSLFTQAWQGFLIWGKLYSPLAEELVPAFISAIARLDSELSDLRDRFIEFYSAIVVFAIENPLNELIPVFFDKASIEDRARFASHLGYILRQMDSDIKRQLWNRWLKKYWEGRLDGIPVPLVAGEVENMLEWLPHLDGLFGEAVSLVIKMKVFVIEPHNFLFGLIEDDLPLKFPIECAELLIYLCKCIEGYLRSDLLTIAKRLNDIPLELKKRLNESLALIGLINS